MIEGVYRRLLILGAVAIAAALPAPLTIGAAEMEKPTLPEEEVLAVVKAFNDAFEANDPERYFTFVDEEIVVLTPSNPYRVEGVADDRQEFEWGLHTGRTHVGYFQELQPLVKIHGDVAIVTYYSRGSYGPDETVRYLKETDVLVRRPEVWKFTHIHVSATSP